MHLMSFTNPAGFLWEFQLIIGRRVSIYQAWSAIQQPFCRLQFEVSLNDCQRPSKMRNLIL